MTFPDLASNRHHGAWVPGRAFSLADRGTRPTLGAVGEAYDPLCSERARHENQQDWPCCDVDDLRHLACRHDDELHLAAFADERVVGPGRPGLGVRGRT